MARYSTRSASQEESLFLLDEKALSDLEADVERIETNRLFPPRPSLDVIRPYVRSLRPSHLRSVALRTSWALLPSFIQSSLSDERPKPKKLLPTAYLDGMRGLAALFVFFCHYAYTCFVITFGYGYGGPNENRNILLLPIIRLLYSGPPMVCVFFIISGYALSLKPLKQMRSHSFESLLTTMSSSVFRRGLRLFIPTFASTFMVLCMLQLGLYEPTRSIAADKTLHRNVQELHPLRAPSFGAELKEWVWQMFNFICVFNWAPFAGSTGYDVHLWTIPTEFRASLMLFLTLIGLAKLRPWIRLTLLSVIFFFVYRNDRWEMMLFYSGMFIAELDLIFESSTPPSSPTPPFSPSFQPSQKCKPPRKLLWISLALISLYLMSQPDINYAETPGWRWLSSLIPLWWAEKYRYWQTFGAIGFFLSVSRLPLLQAPFNMPIVQYLGKISYALYVMHGPVMHSVGYLIQAFMWEVTGRDTEIGYIVGFILGALFNVPLVIWASDVFWRFIDAPSMKFARWLEARLVVSETHSRSKELPR